MKQIMNGIFGYLTLDVLDLDVIKMFSKNWLTLDGLWFTWVEDKYGLDAALDLDMKMWEKQALIESQRIKN